MFEIYFRDLTPEAQERFLAYMDIADESEGNYEVFPITILDYMEDKD